MLLSEAPNNSLDVSVKGNDPDADDPGSLLRGGGDPEADLAAHPPHCVATTSARSMDSQRARNAPRTKNAPNSFLARRPNSDGLAGSTGGMGKQLTGEKPRGAPDLIQGILSP